RGGGRQPRGGYSRRGKPPLATSIDLPPDRNLMEGLLSRSIEEIRIPGASESAFSGALMDDVEYIASYNWTDANEPAIIVPGSPPVWNDRRTPFTLSPDARVNFVDQNAYKMRGSSAFLPVFAAADAVGATIDWPSLDFVTNRNSLRKLMRWIGGKADKEFRIDLELLGENTVLMNRWEKRDREVPKYETFGFSFEEETTNAALGCGSGTGHHRIVRYVFFGLSILARYEVDACLATPVRSTTSPSSSRDVGDVSDLLDSLTVNPSPPVSGMGLSSERFGIKIIKGGSKIPQSAIIELTTRSQNYIDQYDWEEALPQLYLSSTPHLYIGVHRRGTFIEIRKHDLNEDALIKKRREAAQSYKKLGRALEVIQGLVVEHGADGGLSLVCTQGVLRVYRRVEVSHSLPS
ncbi:hypothetical protein K488DRAFT_36454, partial [Vararia minispora EC-137]